MSDLNSFLKPTKMKIILWLTLLIPCLFLSFILLTPFLHPSLFPWTFLQDITIPFILGAIISYLIAGCLDTFTENKNLKIAFAILSGTISILIGYIFYKLISEPMICDPVHIPNQCEMACEQLRANATNATEASRKYMECLQNC